ncbi:DUF4123 domain-containing protein [Vibrio sp. C8]
MPNSWLEPDWGIQALEQSPISSGFGEAKVYLLIESALMPNWQQDIYQHVNKHGKEAPFFASLFTDTAYQHIEQGPVLVDVTHYPSLQVSWLEQFETLPMGCVLLTDNTVEVATLLDTLRHRLTVLKNDTSTFFRYYEPRMLLPLMGALSTEEKPVFLPQVHSIYWYHQQWLQAKWSSLQSSKAPLSSWNVTSQHIENMTTIMTAIQSQEESA